MINDSSKKIIKTIPEFEWFIPIPKNSLFTIKISDEKSFSLNQNLRSQVPKHVKIGISSDGHSLGLQEEENGFFVPKNGVIKASVVIQALKTRGIHLPANYLVEKTDKCWIATLVPPSLPLSLPKKTPKKPRIKGLKALLPKETDK